MTAVRMSPLALGLAFICALALSAPAPARAQYFGQNKVRYRTFDFRVLKTEHFDIYYYDDESAAIDEAGRMAERWYDRLSHALNHELSRRQPVIFYASHPQFEQTNAIPDNLSEGTGGVTEFQKRRIVLPLAGPLAETDHVIGHELVHAFQFDIAGEGKPGLSLGSGGGIQLPLWFVEGMAEYLSLGPVDPHTAMWMRDAAQSNKLPSYARLDDPRYFPYRFGQAFWAYVAGRFGEDAVGRALKAAGHGGDPARALRIGLGVGPDTLVKDWHQATRDWNQAFATATQSATHEAKPLILTRGGGGHLNLAPSLSPDGNRLMFLSEKSLFSIDMYLADAHTGHVIRQITHTAVDPHFQSLQFIQSAGEWSPDGRRFAFAAVSRGTPVLSVMDVASGHVSREASFPGLGEIFSPTWSPDGRQIAFSAIEGGLTDLWIYDFGSRTSRRLTHDPSADLEPAWSPDGRSIAFVTDRFGAGADSLSGQYRLALIDPQDGAIRPVPGFEQGKHINPQWSPDGASLTFLSDRNGIADLYRVTLASGALTQLTNLLTGASGITRLSPAMSVARHQDRIAFSVYEHGDYEIYTLDAPAGGPPAAAFARNPAALPPLDRVPATATAQAPEPPLAGVDTLAFHRTRYRPSLSLDYIAQPSIGIATGSSGTAIGGGAALYWSDMLGNHNLATLLQVNNAGGDFVNNVAAGVGYENMRSRWNWGLTLLQIPYITSGFTEDEGTISGQPVIRDREERFWQIERSLEADVSYPFSRFQRFEFSAGLRNIDFAGEVQTRLFSSNTGELLSDVTTPTAFDSLPSLNLGTAGTALVFDNSVFGGTSPVLGQRYRFGVDAVAGSLQFDEVTADFRRYFMIARPLVLAGRLLHFGRYGPDADSNVLSDLFIGYPSLVRGYNDGSFSASEQDVFDRLIGSRLAVANVELRLPLLGALGVIPSPGVPPVELAGFFDAGTAWRDSDKAAFLGGGRQPVTSAGAALRVNLFGFAIGEVDFVHPNDRPDKSWYWQFALQPGF